jgi:hypothetical protein
MRTIPRLDPKNNTWHKNSQFGKPLQKTIINQMGNHCYGTSGKGEKYKPCNRDPENLEAPSESVPQSHNLEMTKQEKLLNVTTPGFQTHYLFPCKSLVSWGPQEIDPEISSPHPNHTHTQREYYHSTSMEFRSNYDTLNDTNKKFGTNTSKFDLS